MEMIVAILMLCGAGLAVASLRRVPEDTVCTVHRHGRYVRTLTPGIRFTLPFVDKIAHRVRLVGHQVELPAQSFGSETSARGAVYYQILEPERAGDALDDVDALVEREARQCLAAIAAGELPSESTALAGRLKQELNQHLGRLGLRITRCQLQLSAA